MARMTRSQKAARSALATPSQQKLELKISKEPQQLLSPPLTPDTSTQKREGPTAIDNGLPHSLGLTLLPTPGAEDEVDSPPPKKRAKMTRSLSVSGEDDDGDLPVFSSRRAKSNKKTSSATPAIATSITHSAEEVMTVDAPLTLEQRAKVVKGYGLKPGISPYPNYSQPSHDEAYEVVRLLEQHHGVEQVMPPRVADLDRTGCGDVPNILDALLRTYISTQCSIDASNAALQNLGQVYGVKNGSPDWYAVLQGSPEQLRDALKKCGMQTMKARNILRTLRMVWNDEQERRAALKAKAQTGVYVEDASGVVKQYDNIMIGFLDHIHDIEDSYEAMEKMLQFPGMGIKVTACVALFSMGRRVFAVDTHVDRLCKYLGWVPDEKTAKPKLTAERVFAHCDVRLPDDTKYKLHQLFWKHGRQCFRCKEKTTAASPEWAKAKCPIEQLVDRACLDPRKDEHLAVRVKKEKKAKGMRDEEAEQAAVEALEARARDDPESNAFVVDKIKN